MRFLRMIFVALLAILLVGLAIANRQPVVLRPFPAGFEQYLGASWQVTMPLFLIIFLALMLGMVLGLIWEWMRHAQLRGESARRARDIAALEQQLGPRANRDEVLALLDTPPAAPAASGTGATLPARR